MRHLPVLVLVGCASSASGPGPAPTASVDAPASSASAPRAAPTGMIELGPSLGGGRVPSEAHVEIHLPGPDAKRWLTVTVTIGLGTASTIVGCVSQVPGNCWATQKVVLSGPDQEAYVALWREVLGLPRCEPLGRWPGDRPFHIDAGGQSWEGALPAAVADLPARTKGTCEAPLRLAAWIAQRMGAI